MVLFDLNGGPFRFYEVVMKASGVWPLHRNQRRSTIVFSITVLAQIVIVVTSLLHPLKECLPIDLRRRHRLFIQLTITGILSQISLRLYGRSLIPLIEETTADWSTITVPKERDILKRHNRAGRFLFYSLIVFLSAGSVLFVTSMPFIDEFILMKKREPCAFNGDIISSNLLPMLSLISGTFGKLAINLSGSMLFWSLAMHLSARFKILKEQFEDFLLIKVKTVRRKELLRLVDVHNQLIDLSRHLENSFTVFVTINIVKYQLLICTMTFWIATRPDEIFSIKAFHTVIATVGAELVYLHYSAGDYLSASSEEIGDVFTQCNWYNLSKESIKDYSIIIARCQKPCTLTCVKMYKLNLSNLRYVFNAIYSYMSCIVSVVKATQK